MFSSSAFLQTCTHAHPLLPGKAHSFAEVKGLPTQCLPAEQHCPLLCRPDGGGKSLCRASCWLRQAAQVLPVREVRAKQKLDTVRLLSPAAAEAAFLLDLMGSTLHRHMREFSSKCQHSTPRYGIYVLPINVTSTLHLVKIRALTFWCQRSLLPGTSFTART